MPAYVPSMGFSGVTNIGEHLVISQIENNIKSFLDWGFLHIGGFINVLKPQINIYGVPPHKLKATDDPNYSLGQVWQTMRKDWVWEEGIVFADRYNPLNTTTPTLITGIFINNTFYPLATTGQYSYKVDYINSRIIFNAPVPTSLDMSMEYSYRWVQVYTYDNAKWWQQLQYKTDQNAKHFDQLSTGDFSLFSTNRVQLPSVIIESIARGISKPFQLGTKSLILRQDLLLHVVAETMADRNMIIDILRLQQDKFIQLYDTNLVIKSGVGPYNIDGTLNINRVQYDSLITNPTYQWEKIRLINIYASDVESFSPFLAESKIKLTAEVIVDIYN